MPLLDIRHLTIEIEGKTPIDSQHDWRRDFQSINGGAPM